MITEEKVAGIYQLHGPKSVIWISFGERRVFFKKIIIVYSELGGKDNFKL